MFTVQETAARREAEQLRVSQSRSTETVDKLQPVWKPTVSGEQAVPAPRRQQEKQRQDEKKISIRRLPEGTVRDLILLTMWVLSPTNVVVIFVQCIDCSGWAFSVMGCCPQISPSVYIIYDWTMSVYSYFHDSNISKRCFPQSAKHYIQYSLLACHIIMILASLPASCFGPLSGD